MVDLAIKNNIKRRNRQDYEDLAAYNSLQIEKKI